MKKSLILAILIFSLVSCTADHVDTIITAIQRKPSYLKIVNELEEDFYSIHSVVIDKYKFNKLNIAQGGSKKIRLEEELPLEIEGLEVLVTFSSSTRTIKESGIIDLYEGGTTIIWLTGREGCNGCGGHSIEWGWED